MDIERFIRLPEVELLVGLKKSAIYARMAVGTFPRPYPLGDGPNSPVGWTPTQIATWQAERKSKRQLVVTNEQHNLSMARRA